MSMLKVGASQGGVASPLELDTAGRLRTAAAVKPDIIGAVIENVPSGENYGALPVFGVEVLASEREPAMDAPSGAKDGNAMTLARGRLFVAKDESIAVFDSDLKKLKEISDLAHKPVVLLAGRDKVYSLSANHVNVIDTDDYSVIEHNLGTKPALTYKMCATSVDGFLYYASTDAKVVKMDGDGSVLWEKDLRTKGGLAFEDATSESQYDQIDWAAKEVRSLSEADGFLVVATQGNVITLLDPDTGKVVRAAGFGSSVAADAISASREKIAALISSGHLVEYIFEGAVQRPLGLFASGYATPSIARPESNMWCGFATGSATLLNFVVGGGSASLNWALEIPREKFGKVYSGVASDGLGNLYLASQSHVVKLSAHLSPKGYFMTGY